MAFGCVPAEPQPDPAHLKPLGGSTLSKDISGASRHWIERVLSCLGIPSSERQECLARGSVAIGDVIVLFIEPLYGERSFIIVRALVGELPPEGQCERLYQMALEVQANFCGPYVPMLCLDWPSRTLMVSTQIDITVMAADDAAQVLMGLREIALQWRAAIANHQGVAELASPGQPMAATR
jgi:hypothetical protein